MKRFRPAIREFFQRQSPDSQALEDHILQKQRALPNLLLFEQPMCFEDTLGVLEPG